MSWEADWDGRVWTAVVPAALSGLNPVSRVSGISSSGPDDVWAVGPVGLSIHYDGHSWQKVPLPDLNGDEAWLQNVGADRRFGTWAVGYRVGVWVVGTGGSPTPSTVTPFAARSIGDPAGN
jgi:hypothetical protein